MELRPPVGLADDARSYVLRDLLGCLVDLEARPAREEKASHRAGVALGFSSDPKRRIRWRMVEAA